MIEWADKHQTYVLINRNQYSVFLDDLENPTLMWTSVAFDDDTHVTVDGGMPQYKLKDGDILGMGLYSFKMVPYDRD